MPPRNRMLDWPPHFGWFSSCQTLRVVANRALLLHTCLSTDLCFKASQRIHTNRNIKPFNDLRVAGEADSPELEEKVN
ncbi:hypothetical protein I7I48_01762 [Histoplasma ohiense]|nr:hypothetical protein I7I48_01762 [Histoplasma ohiense (nom. inval.)]